MYYETIRCHKARPEGENYCAAEERAQQKTRSLMMKTLRSQRSRERDRLHVKALQSSKLMRWDLKKGGAYTADARAMARELVNAGCSQEKVGSIIQYVGQKAGGSVKKKMSRRTVQRALMEGGIAARIQLAHEMVDANGIVLSTDATTVRGKNYESAHVNKGTTHKMRIFSMTSTTSYSSEAQLANIKFQINTISTLYKQSPLDRRSKFNFEIHDFVRTVKTMHGDHAADAKKLGRLFEEWKNESARILLGYEEIQQMDPSKIVEIVRDTAAKNMQEVGGAEAWSKLSDDEKDTLSKSSMDSLAHRIGEEVFSKLSPEVNELFFWVGCSMHKELNCCVAFEKGMQGYYGGLPESEHPVLLANRDSDATIQLAEEGGESTAAVPLKVSERGAIKLISLFGALVNHKDDKKGLHDVYENYYRPTTRRTSHGCGGARLLTYLEEHRVFMDVVKDNKTKRTLNHMEQNIMKGIHCPKTMIAFVLFCLGVMHPYALQVRGPGTEKLNMLDLGPLHASVKVHIRKLIENPNILLSTSLDAYKLATLDGKPWSDQKVWAACVRLAPTYPDVAPLISAGSKEALDGSRRSLRSSVPPTGSTSHRREWCQTRQQVVDDKQEKDEEKAEKLRKETQRPVNIGVQPDRTEIRRMTDPMLKDQLELHRRGGGKEVPKKSYMKNKAERLAAVLEALDRLEGIVAVIPT
ncbi:hypothetical protein GGX14DRAFT_388880 [Mycena pura]|uniref:Uncharacterized protein n=1 Tax=Mycena pura TaxID=153505 RepID=A0AAD6VW41_9AGAR|nr:hypothetical protein GGX14DRAFT_388880 [Mycena pura]